MCDVLSEWLPCDYFTLGKGITDFCLISQIRLYLCAVHQSHIYIHSSGYPILSTRLFYLAQSLSINSPQSQENLFTLPPISVLSSFIFSTWLASFDIYISNLAFAPL